MILCGVDIETSGLDKEKDFILELGFVIKKHRGQKPLTLGQSFLFAEGQPRISPFTHELTGIEDWMIEGYGRQPGLIFKAWLTRCKEYKVEAFVGHNAKSFDKPFLENYLTRFLEDQALLDFYKGLPWIDTMVDIDYPQKMKGRSLIGLSAEHGFLNPYPHAAVFDSMTSLKLLDYYGLEDCFAPKVKVYAGVGFSGKELARGRGFSYEGDKKKWGKLIKQSALEEETRLNREAGFETFTE